MYFSLIQSWDNPFIHCSSESGFLSIVSTYSTWLEQLMLIYRSILFFLGRRGTKRCWTVEETDCLRKKFRGYLMGVQKSVHQHELREVQRMCPTRTLPQLRAKLNNIKLGKSNWNYFILLFLCRGILVDLGYYKAVSCVPQISYAQVHVYLLYVHVMHLIVYICKIRVIC